jgi:hypothetical protein
MSDTRPTHALTMKGLPLRRRSSQKSLDSELVANTDGWVDVGRVEILVGHPIVHSAVHVATIRVEMIVEVVVELRAETNCLQLCGAPMWKGLTGGRTV